MSATDARIALVTGAGGAIGTAIVERLVSRGDRVVATDADPEALQRLEQRGAVSPDRLLTRCGDVADADAWSEIVTAVTESLGPVSVLVSNAGISPKVAGVRTPGAATPLDEWNRVLAVNLTGSFLAIRAVLPGMTQVGCGRIVVIASQAARTAAKIGGVHYSASKTGLLGLVRTFAHELAPAGITVNAIAPGRIMSNMMAAASADVNQAALARIPVGRFGTPEDVAVAAEFLSGPEAGFITGVTLDVNGGAFMG